MFREPAPLGRPHYVAIGLVLALALAIRIYALCTIDTQPVTDFHWYYLRAIEINQGHGYAIEGKPTAYWPVGYPAFLAMLFALAGPSVLVAKLANTILGIWGIFLSFRLALRWSGSSSVAIATAFLLTINPSWIAYGQILASEPLYTFLTLSALHWLPTKPIQSGIGWGLAILVRPQALLFAFVSLGIFRRQLSGRGLLIALALALIPPVLWTVRNKVVLGAPAFVSTNGGDNLLIGAYGDGTYFNPIQQHQEDLSDTEIGAEKFARSKAIAKIRQSPTDWFSLIPAKLLATFVKGTDASYWLFQDQVGKLIVPGQHRHKPLFKAFRAYSVAYYPVILWAALVGIILVSTHQLRHKKSIKATHFIPHTMIIAQGLTSAIFFGNPRFGYGVQPFFIMLAVAPIGLLTASRNRSDTPSGPDPNPNQTVDISAL